MTQSNEETVAKSEAIRGAATKTEEDGGRWGEGVNDGTRGLSPLAPEPPHAPRLAAIRAAQNPLLQAAQP